MPRRKFRACSYPLKAGRLPLLIAATAVFGGGLYILCAEELAQIWVDGSFPTLRDALPVRAVAAPLLRVAFVGNSLTFYNDLPHLVQRLIQENIANGTSVVVGACLRGGSSFESLWEHGARMDEEAQIGGRDMFPTVASLLSAPNAWDVVVLQDYSQGPARHRSRKKSLHALGDHYLPLLRSMRGGPPLVVLYQTWGYIMPEKDSEEIGDFSAMTSKLEEGYEEYRAFISSAGLPVVVAAAGGAFRRVHDSLPMLWPRLYQADHFHPTGLASFNNAALISAAIASHPPLRGKFSGHGEVLQLPSSWPDGIIPHGGLAPPSMEELAAVLEVAGPLAGAGVLHEPMAPGQSFVAGINPHA